MNNTKLIQLFRTFTLPEMSEFGKFIRSPFYNESDMMIKLYDFIRKYFPDFNDKNFTKQNVYEELYGKIKYDDKKVRDRCSDMLKLAEEYLAVMHFKKDEFMFKKLTLDELLNRKLEVHFEKKYKEAQKILASKKLTDDEAAFFNNYMLTVTHNVFNQYKYPLGKKNNFFDGVSLELEIFFKYFSLQMMRYYAFINHLKDFINIDFNYDFYGEVMKYIDQKNLRKYPLINALWCILKINESNKEDESLYEELKKLYIDSHRLFEENDKIMILTELYNFTHIKSTIPGTRYSRERFEIIKLQIEHDVYAKQEGWMQREQYTTVINAASLVKEFEWMKKFIDKYTAKVVPEFRENSYHWAKAQLYYSQKKYETALAELAKTTNGDYIFYINIKTILIKILFELNEYEQIFSITDSFKHFLNSNTFIPGHVKVRNMNFLNFANRIIMTKINGKKDEFKVLKLLNEIKSCPPAELIGLQWLEDKITEIKNNN